MAEVTNDNAVIYATYVTLYVNDIACNAIKEIEPRLNRKDKKSLKRWRELDKHVSQYFINYRKIVRLQGLYFLSNYNEIIDECADKPLTQIDTAIKYCLKRHGIKDDGLLHKTMVAHILVEFAVTTVESLCETLQKNDLPYKPLLSWRLLKTQHATRELYFRVLRDIDNEVLKEISSMIEPIISMLTGAVAHYENFERAYEYAIKEEEKHYNVRTKSN